MSNLEILQKELDQEALITRKMLERVPNDKHDWKPHEKSMNIRSLATHVAELPSWVSMALNTTELDFATEPYNPPAVNSTNELLQIFEKSLADGRAGLLNAREEDLAGYSGSY